VVFSSRATTCSVVALILCFAAASVSGQQPKRKEPPPPFPLLPAEQAWITVLDAPPSAGGAMDAARVYVPLQSDVTVAIDRKSGKVAWTRGVESAWPPVVADDTVYVAASDEIHALDPVTGNQRWRAPYTGVMVAPLTRVNDRLVSIVAPGVVVAFDLADGAVAWQQPLGAGAGHAVTSDGTRLYLSLDDGRVIALSAAAGAKLWERKLPGHLSEPALAPDRVFIGSDTNDFYALDADSGSVEWKWRAGGDVIGAAADAAGRIYFASLDNLLRAVNRGNGNQRWRKEIATRPALPPRVIHDIVLLTGVAPVVTSYSAKTGAVVGSYTAPAELQGAPLIDPDLKPFDVAIVLLTRSGSVVGLRPTAMLFKEPLLGPLLQLPGTRLAREVNPGR
jgi:outer membrane protein assembly factor BamB